MITRDMITRDMITTVISLVLDNILSSFFVNTRSRLQYTALTLHPSNTEHVFQIWSQKDLWFLSYGNLFY